MSDAYVERRECAETERAARRGAGRSVTDWVSGSAVVEPAWFPSRPGDRVKTDRRDARRLVALHPGRLLTAIVRASGAVDASNQMAETHG